jgi:hypothetical protein
LPYPTDSLFFSKLDSTTGGASKRIEDLVTRPNSGKRRNLLIAQNPRNCGVFVERTADRRNFRETVAVDD